MAEVPPPRIRFIGKEETAHDVVGGSFDIQAERFTLIVSKHFVIALQASLQPWEADTDTWRDFSLEAHLLMDSRLEASQAQEFLANNQPPYTLRQLIPKIKNRVPPFAYFNYGNMMKRTPNCARYITDDLGWEQITQPPHGH